MKEIGRTRDGGVLVEMTKAEYDTFVLLEDAIRGKASGWMFGRHIVSGVELSQALSAIREFIEGQFYINSMQHYVNKLKETMGAVEPNESHR